MARKQWLKLSNWEFTLYLITTPILVSNWPKLTTASAHEYLCPKLNVYGINLIKVANSDNANET